VQEQVECHEFGQSFTRPSLTPAVS